MNFLVDAHLPRHLALLLRKHVHDAIHTLDLGGGNRTTVFYYLELTRISLIEHG